MTIAAFLIGGVIGVVVFRLIGSYLLLACSALLLLIAVDGLRPGRGTFATTLSDRFRWRV